MKRKKRKKRHLKEERQSVGREYLKKVREIQGLSHLSHEIEYDSSTLSKMIRGKRPISKKVLKYIESYHSFEFAVDRLRNRGFARVEAEKLLDGPRTQLKEGIDKRDELARIQAKVFKQPLYRQRIIMSRWADNRAYGEELGLPKEYWRQLKVKVSKYFEPWGGAAGKKKRKKRQPRELREVA